MIKRAEKTTFNKVILTVLMLMGVAFTNQAKAYIGTEYVSSYYDSSNDRIVIRFKRRSGGWGDGSSPCGGSTHTYPKVTIRYKYGTTHSNTGLTTIPNNHTIDGSTGSVTANKLSDYIYRYLDNPILGADYTFKISSYESNLGDCDGSYLNADYVTLKNIGGNGLPNSWKFTNLSVVKNSSGNNVISFTKPTAATQIGEATDDWYYTLDVRTKNAGSTTYGAWKEVDGKISGSRSSYTHTLTDDCKDYEYRLTLVLEEHDYTGEPYNAITSIIITPEISEINNFRVEGDICNRSERTLKWEVDNQECMEVYFGIYKEKIGGSTVKIAEYKAGTDHGADIVGSDPITSNKGANTTTFTFVDNTAFSTNQQYRYKVRSATRVNANGVRGSDVRYSSYQYTTTQVKGGLTTPSAGITATKNETNKTITLNWTDEWNNEDEFLIYKNGDGTPLIEGISANTTSKTFSESSICIDNTYTVKVSNSCSGELEIATTGNIYMPGDIKDTYGLRALLASKGYHSDYVQLDWTVENNGGALTEQKVYRRKLGETIAPALVATVDPNLRTYKDENQEANTLYEYFIAAEGNCAAADLISDTASAIGFRSPYGIVTGRVEYTGGISVEGCQILGESNIGNNLNQSLYFDGDRDHFLFVDEASANWVTSLVEYNQVDLDFVLNDNDKTIEFWANPVEYNSSYIFRVGRTGVSGDYLALVTPSNGNSVWKLRTGTVDYPISIDIHPNEWHHFAITYDNNTETINVFVDGSNIDKNGDPLSFQQELNITKGSFGHAFVVGTNSRLDDTPTSSASFKGYMDEFRLWGIAKSETQINAEMNGFLQGNESGLGMYLRFEEGVGNKVYDASFTSGNNFNNRHGVMTRYTWNTPTFSNVVPSSSKLGNNAVTDVDGNYIIKHMSYADNGEIFNITPYIPNHQFKPNNRTVFVGKSSPVSNNQDFEDISAFPVIGYLFYGENNNDVYCPAAGVYVKVDGTFAIKDGQPVTTQTDGKFDVTVPIGDHYISFEKSGHTFFKGRYPETGTHDFQQPIDFGTGPGKVFVDNTKIKVIGKAVGGTREGDQITGLHRTKNNIGTAKIVLEATGCTYADTVETDQYGEFVTEVFPLDYYFKGATSHANPEIIIESNPTITFPVELVKLSNTLPLQEIKDTVYDALGNVIHVDEVEFHYKKDYIYRSRHTLTVSDNVGNPFSKGEDSLIVFNKGDIDTIYTSGLVYPAFLQHNDYACLIKVSEIYTNNDVGTVHDTVGVTDAQITVNNGLSGNLDVFDITDIDGDSLYVFTVGEPNITQNPSEPEKDFTKKIEITSQIGLTSSSWEMDAYVIGNKQGGTSFVTEGPEMPSHILRDPPGSNSFATLVKDSEIRSNFSWYVGGSIGGSFEQNVKVGAKFAVGVGLATATEIKGSLVNTFDISTTLGGGQDYGETITIQEDISTSADPEFVGADADIYIGKSQNMTFGVADYLEFIPSNACGGDVKCKTSDSTKTASGFTYKLGSRKGFTVDPTDFGTYFIYTQKHIIEDLIPNLKQLRNDLLLTDADYTSKIPATNPLYGSNNDDPKWGAAATSDYPKDHPADNDGPSYTFTKVFHPDSVVIDPVRKYNQQIRLWEEAIALNEEMKVNAADGQSVPPAGDIGTAVGSGPDHSVVLLEQAVSELEKNVSFSSGTSYSRSVTLSNDMSYMFSYEVNVSNTLATIAGATVSGTGIEATNSFTVGLQTSGETSRGESHSIAYEFTLEDENLGDFYSVDILDGGNQNGPIFKIKGAETSCPYEDEVKTKYFEPGQHVLSPATVQRERPGISISPAVQVGIPSDQEAVFTLTLVNENPDDIMIYDLELDAASNPHGAIVSIDGQDPNRSFKIPAGTSINKTMLVQKSPQENEFKDLTLIFQSVCDTSIEVSTTFSVSFVPTCTKSSLLAPTDQWVLNSSFNDTLPYIIGDYDLNFAGFEKAVMRFKPSTSATWINAMSFFNKDNAGADTLLLSRSSPYTTADFDMSNLLDGNYDIQIETTCPNQVKRLSPIYSGIVDRVNPHNFGAPKPINGILSPSDEISIKFNEQINTGLINAGLDIDIRGVLNSTDIAHYTSLYFDGTDEMTIPITNLENRSFSIEFFAKRNATGAEVLAKQDGQWEIGFDAADNFYFNIDGKALVSNTVINNNDWTHYAVVFDNTNKSVDLYVAGIGDASGTLTSTITESTLPIKIGNTFKGNIHELRLWNDVRTSSEITANYLLTQAKNAAGLLGYWTMDKGEGTVLADKTGRRAAIHDATWSFAQDGRAITFDGVDDYFAINSATLNFDKETDFTISFWFKSGSGVNKTLLSNGNIDNSVVNYNESSWAIYSDANSKLYVKNAGYELKVSDVNFFDDNWHHFALVSNRLGNTKTYVDGNLTGAISSTKFSAFGGSKIYIGAYGREELGGETIDQHLTGQIDELKFWYAARQGDQIERDAKYRLKGDEYGLMAYFPFEEYTTNSFGQLVLTETFADLSDKSSIGLQAHSSQLMGGMAHSNTTAPIKIERSVKSVNFTYAVNNDEIIITPITPAAQIENVELDITVRNLQDMNGNKMNSAVTWLAYVDKNQVVWGDDIHQAEILVGEDYQFTVDVVNNSGSNQIFTISNLPSWLQATQTSGNIGALSRQTITFDVLPGLNIGDYEEFIALTTGFGFDEILTLKLNVKAKTPDWTIDGSQFQYSMGLVGEFQQQSIISTDTMDMVAAYVNNELRGVGKVQYISSGDLYRVFLNIYSNSNSIENIVFKAWDASVGVIHNNVTPFNINFGNNAILGTIGSPVVLNTDAQVALMYEVNNGWNWLSFPLTLNDASVNMALNDFVPAAADVFRNAEDYTQYDGTIQSWIGSLDSINISSSFRLSTQKDTSFEITGQPVNLVNAPVKIEPGWNWIGYLQTSSLSVNEALSSVTFNTGDVIKSQQQFAIYDALLGWKGTLSLLEPQKGYMLNSSTNGSIIYPRYANFSGKMGENVIEFEDQIPYTIYPTNMNVIADIGIPDNTILAAYDKANNIRGMVRSKENKFYLTVHGESSDSISFKLLDNDLNIIQDIDTVIPYETNELVYLRISNELSIKNEMIDGIDIQIHPNPFREYLKISFVTDKEELLEIKLTDVVGRVIETITQDKTVVGFNEFTWNSIEKMTEGVYFIKVELDGETILKKIIKQ